MVTLLISFISLVLYTYLFYPAILVLMAWDKPRYKKIRYEDKIYPTVSMIIPAYNEEDAIEKKLRNCLELDYPNDLIEFVVGSDGSIDRTSELVRRFSHSDSRVKLFDFNEREGKASVLNKIAPKLESEIIIFSDANTIYEENAVKELVQHFSDEKIGGICGKLVLVGDNENSCGEENLYWRYENFIKEKESEIKTIVGINGQIFAIRKGLFEPLPENIITEDQVLGMKIIEKGYDILFEPKAVCKERAHSIRGEFFRRVRISAGNFQSIALSKKVLNPKMGFVSFALWSHKILRWLVPFFLISIFITNLFLLDIPVFKFTFFAQIFFYLISFLHYGLTKAGFDISILRTIFYFNIMNLAVLIGFMKFLTRTQEVTWQKIT